MRTIKLLFILASLVILGWIAGCGGGGSAAKLGTTSPQSTQENPQVGYGGPSRDAAVHPPRVVFFGDSTITAWLTPTVLAAHPTWTAMGTPAGVVQETTAELLAREQAVLDLSPKPDIIVVLAGTWDVVAWTQSCLAGDLAGDPCPAFICDPPLTAEANPCQNIASMVDAFVSTEAYIIVSTVPPWGPGMLATTDAQGNMARLQENMNAYNFTLETTYGPENGTGEPNSSANQQLNVSFMDAYGELSGVDNEAWVLLGADGPVSTPEPAYEAAYTTDGVSPDAAGGQVLTQAVMIPIQNSGRGQAR